VATPPVLFEDGVPDIVPVEEPKLRPCGNWPEVIDHVTEDEFPLTCSVELKGTV
jgi:hypothetical protein